MSAGRKPLEPAYVIHRRPYSDTSLIVELLTPAHGRISVLARGVKRGKSQKALLLQPFKSLHVAWLGRGELPILTTAEEAGNSLYLQGEALACGYYVNELIYHLVPKYEPARDLFTHYGPTLTACNDPTDRDIGLRHFELALLEQLGVSPTLDHDTATGQPIDAGGLYYYKVPDGPIRADIDNDSLGAKNGIEISGESLLHIAAHDFSLAKTLTEAKKLTRALIHHQLDGKELMSRALFQSMKTTETKPDG